MRIYVHIKIHEEEKELFRNSFHDETIIFNEDNTQIDMSNVDIIVGNLPVEWLVNISNVKLIQTDSAGIDNYVSLDWQSLQKKDVSLGNIGDFYSVSVAEEALAGILILLRNIPEILQFQEKNQWNALELRSVKKNLTGKTVSILGYGSIGKEIARILSSFHCEIIALRSKDIKGKNRSYLRESIQKSSILISTIPYNPQNQIFLTEDILLELGIDGILGLH